MITYPSKLNQSQVSDSHCSLTSSTRSSKRLERTSSKNSNRSLSRQSNLGVFKNFFVKNVCAQQLQRGNALKNTDQSLIKKKRDPTPCKSKKLISSNHKVSSISSTELKNLEMTITISEIQEQLKKKDDTLSKVLDENQNLKGENSHLQRQVKMYQERNIKLCEETSKLSFKLKQSEEQNLKLEEIVLLGEQNLAHAKSNLDKIKKSIQDNRAHDLKKQNEIYRSQVQQLNKNICLLQIKIKQKQEQLLKIENQNMILKSSFDVGSVSCKQNYLQNQVQRLRIILAKTDKQKQTEILQSLINTEQQKDSLRKEVEKLTIQLNYIQRKHLQQIKIFAKAKSDEVIKLKNKYKDLQDHFDTKKKQWQEKLLQKNLLKSQNETRTLNFVQLRKNAAPYSSSLFRDERSRKLSISFSLSPE